MPLIVLATLSFAAGLLVGFGGAVVPALAIAGAVSAGAAVRRQVVPFAMAGLVATGALTALARQRSEGECRVAAVRRGTIALRLAAPARAGGMAWGSLEEGGCRVRGTLHVERGAAAENALVRATGRVERQGDRLFVRDARLAVLGGPPRLARIRQRIGALIDTLYAGDAPLVRALVIADQRAIAQEVRARFADAGIVHLLSVSGLHVAVIGAAAELCFLAMRLSRRAAAVGALAITIAYVATIGLPPPAVRAATMFAATAASRLAQRPTSPWGALALGALVPLLIDPVAVSDVGYQLSVVGMASLVASAALARRVLAARGSRAAGAVLSALLVSGIASVATLPIVAWNFGRVSLIAPLVNLLVGPIYGVVQPMLFLGVALAPARPVARFVAGAAHPPLAAADLMATVAARIPFAAIDVAPSMVESAMLGVLAVAVLVACAAERPVGAITLAVAAIAGLAWAPLASHASGQVELHMMDVGQGDALALRTPRGRWIVIDAGRVWRGGDAGRQTVIPYLRQRGGEIAAFVLTHPHADHVGGAAAVVRTLAPSVFVDGGYVAASAPYVDALDAAATRHVPWHRAHPGDSLVIDGVTLELLAPDSAYAASLDDPNAASTIVRARYGRVRFLLVGDAERAEESWLLANEPDRLDAEVLKVGHHGSRTSSGPAFLDAVHPRIALVSVGAGNTYGHPSAETLERLVDRGAYVLRTDQVGSVVVRTDGRRLILEAGGASWEPSAREWVR